LYHFLVGVLDFSKALKQDRVIDRIDLNRPASSLVLALFCLFGVFFVLPLWFLQISNLVQNTTTSRRFAFEVKIGEQCSEILNERIMMLPESDGWISRKVSHELSYRIEGKEDSCCIRKKERGRVDINNTSIAYLGLDLGFRDFLWDL
jgi:hypothetical protein